MLADTEAKAVEDNLRARRREGRARPRSGSGAAAAVPVGRWAYDERGGNATVVLGQGGAGNNWAHGYGLLGGMTESEEEGVRDAAAAADGGGSGGGGSGGGLGSVSGDGGRRRGMRWRSKCWAVRREAERMDSYSRRGAASAAATSSRGRLDSIVVCSSAAGARVGPRRGTDGGPARRLPARGLVERRGVPLPRGRGHRAELQRLPLLRAPLLVSDAV